MTEARRVPYPGLRPFRRDEADLFFGRDEQVAELLDLLERSRFIALIGTSGCGKSSLLHAGLLPELERGMLSREGTSWRLVTMRPGAEPLHSLAAAVHEVLAEGSAPLESVASLFERLGRSPFALSDVLAERGWPATTNLLIVVDQFEELFRIKQERPGEAADFVYLLLRTAEQRDVPIFVVIGLRSDYLGDCSVFSGLPESVNRRWDPLESTCRHASLSIL